MAHSRPSERGATLVEFAIVAPFVFLLIFGVIEFARVTHAYSGVWTAAREGARYATTVGDSDSDGIPNHLDCDAIAAAVSARTPSVAIDPATQITVSYDDGTGTVVADCDDGTGLDDPVTAGAAGALPNGTIITVRVSGIFTTAAPILEGFLDGIDLSSEQSRSVFSGKLGT